MTAASERAAVAGAAAAARPARADRSCKLRRATPENDNANAK